MEMMLFIAGFLFISLAFFLITDHLSFKKTAHTIRGTVIAIERYVSVHRSEGRREHRTFYRPVVEYVADGQSYRFNHTGGRESIKHRLRQTVPVLVNRDNPADARLDNNHRIVMGSLFGLVGLSTWIVFLFVYELTRISIGIGAGFILMIATVIFSVLRKANIRSLQGFKQQWRNSNHNAQPAGSPHDPMLQDRSGGHAVLFTTREELSTELGRIARIELIISLGALIIGGVMVWFGWGIYQKEMASPQPEAIKAYGLLAMGGIFVISSLKRLMQSAH